MHILYLDQFFRPPDGIGNTSSYEVAHRWVQSGHSVTIVTSAAELPDTYGVGQYTLDGIQLNVTHASRRAPTGAFGKIWRALQFTVAATWRAIRVSDVDIIFVAPPSRRVMGVGVVASLSTASPFAIGVSDFQDSAPGKRRTVWQSVSSQVSRAMNKVVYRAAHHVIAFEPGIKDALITEGVDDAKVTVIPDGCDTQLFRVSADHGANLLEVYPHLKGGPLVVFCGPLDAVNAVGYLIDVAEVMLSVDPNIRFVVCGDGPVRSDLRAHAMHAGVFEQNLWLLPALPRHRLPELLSIASAVTSLSPVLEEGQHKLFPEIFDALASGKPVVSNHGGWCADLVESRGAGIKISQDDIKVAVQDIADFVCDSEALRRATEQAAALADSRFNRDKLTNELRTILESVAQNHNASSRRRRRSLAIKRVTDFVLALTALVLLSPVMMLIAFVVLIRMGRPVLYTHTRPGLGGQPFHLVKFRTMDVATDASGEALPDGDRLTPFGRILRRTSLDELPELFNVLVGEMSLVGPRPLLMEYLPYYDQNQARRHSVRPGITGWAQINGRNALTWEEKFDLDCWYVENRSLWLDIKILVRTVWVVVSGKGVSAPGHDSMPRFDEIMARRQGAEDI